MPTSNPLLNGSAAGATPRSGTPADAYPTGGGAAMPRATGVQAPFSGDHNTAAHVGTVVLIAVGVLLFLQISGFRFVVDAGIGGR